MTKSKGILPPRPRWEADQVEILTRLYSDTPTHEIARQLGITVARVYSKAAYLGLKKSEAYLNSPSACRLRRGDNVGASARFQKGHTTWNKGMKGLDIGGKSSRFKKGQLPHNTQPIGSYRVTKDGSLQRKISNAKGSNSMRWRGVHELVWIDANGFMPQGHIVVFKKGMKTSELDEITIDKVECISFAENMKRNSYHQYGPEIAQLVQLRGAVQRQINRREKKA